MADLLNIFYSFGDHFNFLWTFVGFQVKLADTLVSLGGGCVTTPHIVFFGISLLIGAQRDTFIVTILFGV